MRDETLLEEIILLLVNTYALTILAHLSRLWLRPLNPGVKVQLHQFNQFITKGTVTNSPFPNNKIPVANKAT